MKITVSNIATPQTVQIQSVGHVYGMEAAKLKEGDVMVWNFGQTSTVGKTLKDTAAFITIEDVNEKGIARPRRVKKTRVIATTASTLTYAPTKSTVVKYHRISSVNL